jgi:hypothetical protein
MDANYAVNKPRNRKLFDSLIKLTEARWKLDSRGRMGNEMRNTQNQEVYLEKKKVDLFFSPISFLSQHTP